MNFKLKCITSILYMALLSACSSETADPPAESVANKPRIISIEGKALPSVVMSEIDEAKVCAAFRALDTAAFPLEYQTCQSAIISVNSDDDRTGSQILSVQPLSNGNIIITSRMVDILTGPVDISILNRDGRVNRHYLSGPGSFLNSATLKNSDTLIAVGGESIVEKDGQFFSRGFKDSVVLVDLPKGLKTFGYSDLTLIWQDNSLEGTFIYPRDGGYIVMGAETNPRSAISEFRVILLDENGLQSGETLMPSKMLARPQQIKRLSNGDFLLMGWSQALGGRQKIILTRINSQGNLVWETQTALDFIATYSMAETRDGNLWAAGAKDMDPNGDEHIQNLMVYKFDAEGNIIFSKVYENEMNEYVTAILPLENDDAILTIGFGDIMFSGVDATVFARIDKNGEFLSKRYDGNPEADTPFEIRHMLRSQDGRTIYVGYDFSGHNVIAATLK